MSKMILIEEATVQQALEAQPAQPEQEPVVWRWRSRLGKVVTAWLEYKPNEAEYVREQVKNDGGTIEYAYASPPQPAQPANELSDLFYEAGKTIAEHPLAQPAQPAQPEPIAALLLQSKQNHECKFGPSAAADWIYSDLLELLDTDPSQRQPLTPKEVKAKCRVHGWMHGTRFEDAYTLGIRDAEAAHGIKGDA